MKAGHWTPNSVCKSRTPQPPPGGAPLRTRYPVARVRRWAGQLKRGRWQGDFCEKSCNSFHQGVAGNHSPERDHRYPMELRGCRL